MKAFILVRTKYGTSIEVINELRKDNGRRFIEGRTVYGWYDTIVELEVPDVDEINKITYYLKQNQLDIDHIDTIIEKPDDLPSTLQSVH